MPPKYKKTEKIDLYESITEKILEKLEQGVVPWHKPWDVKTGMPCNITTGKPYNGINIMLLGSQSYDSKYWLTFKQCHDNGGMIKKGEKGSTVVFWTFIDKAGKSVESDAEQSSTNTDKIPFLRHYTVFNVNQCSGLDLKRLQEELAEKDLERTHEDFTPAEILVDNYVDKPEIKYGFTRACYRPLDDEVNLPSPQHFKSTEEYYSTLFHELVHSTGHENRLNRRNSSEMRVFGDEDYSKEELVAEMGASFLCARAGIDNKTIDNSAAYIQSWMKALKDDKKMLITAAGQAQKASSYIADGLGKPKTIELSPATQDIDKAVADGRVPKDLVDALRGPSFGYTDTELIPVITNIAEHPSARIITSCIIHGTIHSRAGLEHMTRPPASTTQMDLKF